jgi:hypothetical protein
MLLRLIKLDLALLGIPAPLYQAELVIDNISQWEVKLIIDLD